jgi:hypothetical protein
MVCTQQLRSSGVLVGKHTVVVSQACDGRQAVEQWYKNMLAHPQHQHLGSLHQPHGISSVLVNKSQSTQMKWHLARQASDSKTGSSCWLGCIHCIMTLSCLQLWPCNKDAIAAQLFIADFMPLRQA